MSTLTYPVTNPAPIQYPYYATLQDSTRPLQQQPSPPHSSPSTSASPTSPMTLINPLSPPVQPPRQLRPMKTPLYVPAVLRPTERPRRPLTPPGSIHAHDRRANKNNKGDASVQHSRNSSIDHRALIHEDFVFTSPFLGPVNGVLPTREHWKPDANAPVCEADACTVSFSLLHRRHHCRHCGRVFCTAHSNCTVPLDQNARFHPDGAHVRACDECWTEWSRWETERVSRFKHADYTSDMAAEHLEDGRNADDRSSADHGSATHGRAPSTPSAVGWDLANRIHGKISAAASSVPRDWNWSTF